MVDTFEEGVAEPARSWIDGKDAFGQSGFHDVRLTCSR
jgi:hypothetical protein